MKKQITRPDGTVEVVEGTAEELAEYERNLQEAPKKKSGGSKKRLLNEETLRAMIAEEVKKIPTTHFHFGGCHHCNPPVILPSPIWIEPQPYIEPYYPQPGLPWYTITCNGTSSDKIVLGGSNPVDGKLELTADPIQHTSGYIQHSNFLVQN